jgi:hypothetical protein
MSVTPHLAHQAPVSQTRDLAIQLLGTRRRPDSLDGPLTTVLDGRIGRASRPEPRGARLVLGRERDR